VAVLEEGTRRLNEVLLTGEITSETVTARIAEYMDNPAQVLFNEVFLDNVFVPDGLLVASGPGQRPSCPAQPNGNRFIGFRESAVREELRADPALLDDGPGPGFAR
jgi:hypothetical protein